jgi:hypothetical protein
MHQSKFAYGCEQKNNGVKPVLRGHLWDKEKEAF